MEGHDYEYPVSDVLRMFFGHCITISSGRIQAGEDSEAIIHSSLSNSGVRTWIDGEAVRILPDEVRDDLPPNREVKRQLYLLLSRYLGVSFPWGSLTGIRPTMVAREEKSAETLENKYFVRPDKARLAMETAINEDKILEEIPEDSFGMYIGVPFCKSRCSYCSFISAEASGHLAMLPDYSNAVISEMAGFFKANPPDISCLYIGGGTPTVFDDVLFKEFIHGAFRVIAGTGIKEITVEAGRPDTITEQKLRVLKDAGVSRICINPQTLSDRTLIAIGRKHTTADFFRAYDQALKFGFRTINTDLIAGLPNETAEDFSRSIDTIIGMRPDNITVHTLSKKRRSEISRDTVLSDCAHEINRLDQMLNYSHSRLNETGYSPYYLYRQKDTVGGHENTGYSTTGHACAYNVAMMSDRRSILAFGAGSVSKRAFPDGHLERCPNIRDPHEYILRSGEMAHRKTRFFYM